MGRWNIASIIRVFLPSLALLVGIGLSQSYRYTAVATDLYSAPSPNARLLLVIPPKNKVMLEGCRAGWCSVSYDGKRGYVAQRYLTAQLPTSPLTVLGKGGYVNSQGNRVPSPSLSPNAPPPGHQRSVGIELIVSVGVGEGPAPTMVG